MDVEEICLIANIGKNMANIRDGLEQAIENLKADKAVFQPEDLLEELKNAESWKDRGIEKSKIAGAKSAQKYIKQIVKMQVFTSASTSIDCFT